MGAPLTLGYGDGETYLGSDALALAALTQRIAYLDEGDWAVVTRDGAEIFDRDNNPVQRPVTVSGASSARIEKGNHRHYMQKEIYEQPIVVAQTLQSYLRPFERKVALPDMDFSFADVPRITIVACGTSYYAGMVAKYWLEQFARVPVELDIASEFRYRQPVLEEGGLALFISQSGETADTLRRSPRPRARPAHRRRRQRPDQLDGARGGPAPPTRAGPEIGVASTKAFTCQLAVLAALAAKVAATRAG
jgi:glucosamine--fructose-6-phosphate aminotransferase (isomerizing)